MAVLSVSVLLVCIPAQAKTPKALMVMKEVKLPRKFKTVTDLLSGEVVARDADGFVSSFATPDTRLFLLSDE